MCICRWRNPQLFNIHFSIPAFLLRWLWMLNVRSSVCYQVICMYPRSLSFSCRQIRLWLLSRCYPPSSTSPPSEQCRTSLPCLVLKQVKRANVFCPYQFSLLSFDAFSHASPVTGILRTKQEITFWNVAYCTRSYTVLSRSKQVCSQKCSSLANS